MIHERDQRKTRELTVGVRAVTLWGVSRTTWNVVKGGARLRRQSSAAIKTTWNVVNHNFDLFSKANFRRA